MIKAIYKKIFSEKFRINLRINLSKITFVFYRGNQLYCNCCNKSFKKFHSKGRLVKRENAECPYCGSLERTRVLLFYLQNETDLFKKNKIKLLHFAPERTLFDVIKKLDIEYVDGDINAACARNIIDITSIPYPDNYFDIIICSHVLAHVPNEEKAIRELKRVLSKDGIALIMTLIDLNSQKTYENADVVSPEDRILHYSEPDLYRLHGLDFELRLQNQGFQTEAIDYRKHLLSSINTKYSLGDGQREIIFKCCKVC